MKSKRNLMTVLVGLAMLATPITAAAKDYKHDAANTSRPSHSSSNHASTAPARGFTTTTRVGTANEYRNQGAVAHRDWVDNHRGWTPGYSYGHPGYYANRPYYGGPANYGAPGYAGYGGGGGGSCARARQIMTVYQQDRYRGHPAAAADVLRQNQWAFRSGCGGAPVGGGGGLFNGFGGLGGGGAPYGGGYGGGYGQPYGGGLGGMLQQFIH